ncbi:BamA/TamA family outer membrane protein [Mucilaginibacter aquariorum]|uniref:Outer membrane protein assembly factor n=1 Tax=Mucilaginibacter aquariorum TaxID=2967225 RepID=A0ABT1SWC3_9SPHI|nr:BamA/TamA family outer membrane protein [Mucilaginibacter aquariorum]MCQ6956510.1 outer membrane protein assembly factor [Mucilaginibacter aquariorum]
MKYFKILFCLILLFIRPQLHAQSIKNDSITIAVAPEYDKVGKVRRLFFGENYRKLWAVPVKIKVFHLQTEKGGLTIVQKGGGMQTKSLRLRDPSGQEWVLRTIQKYAERVLPPNLRQGVARDILQDQVSTANPFAALTVPPLADALHILHANPQIVYVPDDPALGKYRKDFANDVFLFEEHEPLESDKTDNTTKVQEKLRDDNDVRFDYKMVLRARLLDMILGDWDRHDDQWRWNKNKKGKSTVYTPIPRDRDQVYYKTGGIFPWIVAHQWLKARFQPYSSKIRDIKAWNLSGQYFDRYFLNQLSETDWKEQIAYVQANLTDKVIEDAFKRLPGDIYKLSAPQLISTMKARRDNIATEALEYYRFLAQIVEVPLSDKREHFDIRQETNGKLNITINKVTKNDSLAQIIYHREFEPNDTKEIRLYGFDGKDVFNVTGEGRSPIKVRMIGGSDVDTFKVAASVDNKRNLYIYDRSDKTNIVPDRSEAKLRLSTDTAVNNYDKKSYRFDRFEPIILGQYNNDYGVSLVGGFSYVKHGFRKEPHAYKHELLIDYSLARKSFFITYAADYRGAIGNNDLNINVVSRGPNSVNNFFGIGNETQFIDRGNKEIEFYRNRYDLINADVRLAHQYSKLRLNAGVAGQYYTSAQDNNMLKFLNTYAVANPQQDVFSSRVYAGLVAGADYDTRNNANSPSKGVLWHTTLTGLQQLNRGNDRFGQLLSEFTFFLKPTGSSDFVISNKTGVGTTVGDAAYYQQLKLGGMHNLRGFHSWRFTGRTMAYNNFDVRLKLFDFNSYLFPGSVGITGFNDVGRVWVPNESSSKWHDGYGYGVYVVPAELIFIQFSQGFSTEGRINYISLGYRF